MEKGQSEKGRDDGYLLLGKMASLTARRKSSARTGASSKAAEAIATLAAAISALHGVRIEVINMMTRIASSMN